MEELKKSFPAGVDYKIVYDTTPFVRESIDGRSILRDAIILVAIVVLCLLQSFTDPYLITRAGGDHRYLRGDSGWGSASTTSRFWASRQHRYRRRCDRRWKQLSTTTDSHRWKLPGRRWRGRIAHHGTLLVLMAVFIPCAFISGITAAFAKLRNIAV